MSNRVEPQVASFMVNAAAAAYKQKRMELITKIHDLEEEYKQFVAKHGSETLQGFEASIQLYQAELNNQGHYYARAVNVIAEAAHIERDEVIGLIK
jgi:uncharacterized lipoprotein YmbA